LIRRPSRHRGPCHDDGGAGAAGLGEIAARGEAHRQSAAFAAYDGAIPIGSIERPVELPAAGAAAPACVAQLARVARCRHRAGGAKGWRPDHVRAQVDEHRQRVAWSGPVDARLHRRPRRDPHRARTTSAFSARQPGHGPHEWLTYGEHVGLGEEQLERFPVLLVGQREGVRAHRLADVHAQGRPVTRGDARKLHQPPEIRTHHDGDDRDRYAEPAAPFSLRVHEIPVARAALRVLLLACRVVERELQVVEPTNLLVGQQRHAQAVRGHRQLDVPAPQKRQHLAKLRVHAVLTGAEIHGVHGQAVEDRSNLLEVEAIPARGVPIAERAREVALVRETEPQRETRRFCGGLATCVGCARQSSLIHRRPLFIARSPRRLTPPA